ncbi:membrane dipeptidase [Metabacillus sp. KIGAM252]|uniref:Membrane dipeptidase n=1 Tax=Metabacillus flavus TaxID=2823519 RepID=A0ABS5LEW8_9BACI|nr:membrane dipeptidase [Metabacillus flavus]MBS2969063.1 membrane dipeptidase [Metabacillus flavus]
MKIFDAHCDMLLKLWLDPSINPWDGSGLHTNLEKLIQFNAKIQCLAIYIPANLPADQQFGAAMAQIRILYEKILKPYPQFKLLTAGKQQDQLEDEEIGIILSLEGCDCIGNQLDRVSLLHKHGVRIYNLTWNYANLFADGALEKRNAGLSLLGKTFVDSLNELNAWIDVSHLSERSFWDVMEAADHVTATHSNAYSLLPHPRNLRDSQIKTLIDRDAPIGITFVPDFISKDPSISMLLNHLEHICSLGGEKHTGLGSDFDGISDTVPGLNGYEEYDNLLNEIYKRYSAEVADGIVFQNFAGRIPF